MHGRRSIARLAAPLAAALVLAACSDAPSAMEVTAAVAQVQAAPEPDGTSPTPELPTNLGAGTPVPGTDVFRFEQCSDGACPAFIRYFTTLRYPTMEDACAALGEYVRAVGGEPPAGCPPEDVAAVISGDGTASGFREDLSRVPTESDDVADFVVFKLAYATQKGEWDGTTPVELTLGVGVQLGSL